MDVIGRKVEIPYGTDKVERTYRTAGAVGVVVAVVAAIAIAGCGEPGADRDVPAPTDASRVLVEAHLEDLDEVMVRAARRRAFVDAVDEVVDEESERPFSDRVEEGLRYSTVFERTYVENDGGEYFVDEWGLTGRGRRVMEVVDRAERHGLEVETFHRRAIDKRLQTLVDRPMLEPHDGGFTPTVREVEALVDHVREVVDERGEGAGVELLVEAVGTVDDVPGAPERLERFRAYNRREADHFADRARTMAELELLIADAALRYARQMHHKNLKRVDRSELVERGSTEIVLERMQRTLGELRRGRSAEIKEVFRDLEPAHPQYRALLEATDEYRDIVEQGGWHRVRPFEVEPGESSARVERLRDRLEAEGFEARPADPDPDYDSRVVDEALLDGIRAYQRTHQFRPDGRPTGGFWRSLDTPAADRLEQMELTLRRWRESPLAGDEDYVFVNIPGFRARVRVDGEVEMEFPVVVGNNERRCDADDEEWRYPNATPTLFSELDHVMLNPYWYVPDRIIEEELKPELEENEDFYEEEGYEQVEMADGREVVRQKPGEDNALGRAKFIFPNADNIYLHDTPEQHFFDYGVRAFSHGCIRVSKPVELAKFLLDREGRDDVDVDEVLAGDETRRYDIEERMPVFLEYYTVWVDDEGEPNFLADIYDRDARRLADDPEEFLECNPAKHRDETGDEEETETEAGEAGDGDGEEQEPEDVDDDIGP